MYHLRPTEKALCSMEYFILKISLIVFTFEAGPNIGQLNDSLKGLYRLRKIGAN